MYIQLTQQMIDDMMLGDPTIPNFIDEQLVRIFGNATEDDLLRGIYDVDDKFPPTWGYDRAEPKPTCCFRTVINGYTIDIFRKDDGDKNYAQDVKLQIDGDVDGLERLNMDELRELVRDMTDHIAQFDAKWDNHMWNCCG